jgi:hypothetical protein
MAWLLVDVRGVDIASGKAALSGNGVMVDVLALST